MEELFTIQGAQLWGDYGDVLVSGFCERSENDGPLRLQRTGPFLPPISFPWGERYSSFVVSDGLKQLIETDQPFAVEFREAVYDRVIDLDWHNWPLNASEPLRYPAEEEPENYIFGQRHSARIAKTMPKAWEVKCPTIECISADALRTWSERELPPSDRMLLAEKDYPGLFCPENQPYGLCLIDEPTKQWFERHAKPWISFEPVSVEFDPEAPAKLDAILKHRENVRSHHSSEQYQTLIVTFCEQQGIEIPPAFERSNLSFSRYCVVQSDATPPKLSVMTYEHHDAVAEYLEHKMRVAEQGLASIDSLMIYDLELNQQLIYQGDGEFLLTAPSF